MYRLIPIAAGEDQLLAALCAFNWLHKRPGSFTTTAMTQCLTLPRCVAGYQGHGRNTTRKLEMQKYDLTWSKLRVPYQAEISCAIEIHGLCSAMVVVGRWSGPEEARSPSPNYLLPNARDGRWTWSQSPKCVIDSTKFSVTANRSDLQRQSVSNHRSANEHGL